MAGKIHYEGQSYLGSASLKNQGSTTLYIGLYSNTGALTKEQNSADVQEITGGGYARITLNASDWVEDANKTPEQGTLFSQPRKTFYFDSPVGNVYGYFITNAPNGTSGKLIMTEHFAAPVNVNQSDFEIRITPRTEFK